MEVLVFSQSCITPNQIDFHMMSTAEEGQCQLNIFAFSKMSLYDEHFYFILFFFLFSLMSLSRLFHSYQDEPIGRWGKTVVPRENYLTHLQEEHGLSHMWPVQGSNLHQTQR